MPTTEKIDELKKNEDLQEKRKKTMCGIIGVFGPEKAGHEVYGGLMTLQHRGQDGAGILTYDSAAGKFNLEKNKGLVTEAFSAEGLNRLKGQWAIGHTRYATVGSGRQEDLQPLWTSYPYGLGMVHNGNVVNYFDLVEKLKQNHLCHMLTGNDLEVIQHILGQGLQEHHRPGPGHTFSDSFDLTVFQKAVQKVLAEVKGGYSVIGIVGSRGLFAFRDPHGIRPLVLGQRRREDGKVDYCLSSESGTLNFLDYEYVRNVEAGELIFIDFAGEFHSFQLRKDPPRPCMFEWVYFAGAEGKIEDISVYQARVRLGHLLGKRIQERRFFHEIDVMPDMVVPVPETGRVAAQSLAEELGIPFREVLIKNRYLHRSFILNSQEAREKAVELKLIPISSEIEGKNILIVDDSIVRGTTGRRIVKMLRKHGARAVIFVSTCPPVRFPCFYGVDFPDTEELLASGKGEREIAQHLGAEGVFYLELPDLLSALGLPAGKKPCLSCLNGDYPVDVSDQETFQKNRIKDRQSSVLL